MQTKEIMCREDFEREFYVRLADKCCANCKHGEIECEELKPCPFCGSKARLERGTEDHEIVCSNPDCEAAIGVWTFLSKADAIAAWNRRV